MDFLLVRGQNKSVSSLFSQGETPSAQPIFPKAFPVRVAVVNEIADTSGGSRYYQPDDMSLWAVRAAIGNPYTLPVAGTYTLTFTALDTTTETTSALAYNATASQVQTALNAGAKMIAAGGVIVTGENGYFFIAFNNAANRSQITGNAANLAPLSIIEAGTLINGSGSLDEVQTIRVTQNPATFVELSDLSAAAGASVTVLATGGTGVNHKVRVTLSPLPYDGQFTITVASKETAFIAFDASADDVATALGALSTVASVNNVQVLKEAAGQYVIAFIAAKAETNIGTITADATALVALRFLSGVLTTGVPGVELLLDSANAVSTFFEIEGERDGGDTEELLLSDITLRAGVITEGAMQPQPGTTYEARVAALEAASYDSFLPTVTNYTGGGSSKLDGVVTVGRAVPYLASFDGPDGLEFYELIAGTTAESSPSVIRPDDYNGSTNAKVWVRKTFQAIITDAGSLPVPSDLYGGTLSVILSGIETAIDGKLNDSPTAVIGTITSGANSSGYTGDATGTDILHIVNGVIVGIN